jgi:hypothetical protein
MAFSSSGTLIAGGATSKNLVYYVWEDYIDSPSSFTTPQCLETPLHDPTSGYTLSQIMRIDVSRDNDMVVSIICCFFPNSLLGPEFSTFAEMVTLGGDSVTISPRTLLVGTGPIRGTPPFFDQRKLEYNHVVVSVYGRDQYAASKESLVGFTTWDFAVSSRFGNRPGAVTVGGIEITPPAPHNPNTCTGFRYEREGGCSWVSWRGKRLICLPYRILWARRDL